MLVIYVTVTPSLFPYPYSILGHSSYTHGVIIVTESHPPQQMNQKQRRKGIWISTLLGDPEDEEKYRTLETKWMKFFKDKTCSADLVK